MTDKKVNIDIKSLKSFLEFWGRFHSIYGATLSKELVTADDENRFLETKAMIRSKYDELKKGLEFKYMPHGRPADPVEEVLSLKTVRFTSENSLKKMEGDWKDSYVFLNNIIEQLANKKRISEDLNPVGTFFRRIFQKE